MNSIVDQDEIWLPVVGYDDYEVSNLGRVKSIDRYSTNILGKTSFIKSKFLTLNVNYNGYIYVMLWDGKRHQARVNRLVAKAFLLNPDNLPAVNHKNGIKSDNRLTNLEWISHRDNNLHLFRELGYIIHNRKLNYDSVKDIYYNTKISRGKENRPGILSMKEMAKKYDVTTRTINNIILKRVYIDIVSKFEDIPYFSSDSRMPTENLKKKKLKSEILISIQ